MPIDWQPFTKLVGEARSFVLTSHMRPDCDAIGSEIGLALALRSLGKTVRIVNGDPVPPHIAFIDPNRDVKVLGRDTTEADLKSDVLAVLDTSAWSQLGPMGDVVRNTSARRVVIDHHVSQDDMSAEVFKDTSSESSGRLVLQAIESLGATLTPQIVVASEGRITILDTRKTTPGFRALEKYAVRAGGGTNHRMSLDDGVLIKDNHIRIAKDIGNAVKQVRAWGSTQPVEVEVTTLDEVDAALEARADILLLDNMTTDVIREAVRRSQGRAKTEISGGVTLARIPELAATGA